MKYDPDTKTFQREISDVVHDVAITLIVLSFIGFGVTLIRAHYLILGALVVLPSILYIGFNLYAWWFVWCLQRELIRQGLKRGK